MKIDRLIGILSILLQQKKVTAPYLAEKFEVSRRTIGRDIDAIQKAGIPIITERGQNGGISIMDGYRIDRTLLTPSEMESILAGLKGLDSISDTNKYKQLMEKLSAGSSSVISADNHIAIDLSSWHKSSLAPKIKLILSAIENSEKIKFVYYSPKGKTERMVEPYLLVFKWSSWYAFGYCTARSDFRLFKLNRMLNLELAGTSFIKRETPPLNAERDKIFPAKIEAETVFEPEVKWRLIDEYGPESFEEQPDGKLLLRSCFTDKKNLFAWLLSFGDKASLVSPDGLRIEFLRLLDKIIKKYN